MHKVHLRLHERKISDFTKIFKELDTDSDGILNQSQSKQFIN